MWDQVRRGLTKVALYAMDKCIDLALQTHPEITVSFYDLDSFVVVKGQWDRHDI
ncbi:MAG TPA: hypothetical protein VMW24_28245 [Sedimentisphaerales bacterium]|nr:hypothetical protein [Sedimentisphaerales bacterium]